MKVKSKGVVLIIISAFFFALMNVFVRLSGDLPTFQKALFRNIIATIFAFVLVLKDKESFIPKGKENIIYLIARTLFGLIGVICNFYAVDYLVVADASILNKMSPFFALIFSFVIVKEKPKLIQWFLIFGAFIGAIFVIKPTFANAKLLPAFIGFIGGMCAGIAYACVRKLGLLGVNKNYIIFFFSFCSTIILTPISIAVFKPMSIEQVFILLGAGISAALGQFFITYAYTCVPAKEISIYDYSQIIFAALLGFIFFRQVPDIFSIIGYIIIVSMATTNFIIQNKKAS